MTEHEKLMEYYEDALLRLLMENAARREGEELLPELGPAPAEQDALGDSLRRHYRRERRRRVGEAILGFLGQAAVFLVITALLFSTALAASETVRSTARFKGGSASAPSVSVWGGLPQFEATWLPWGFELEFSDDSSSQYRRYYADLTGSFIDATCLYLDGAGIDPDPGARKVDIEGRTGFLLTSGSVLQLIVPVEEQGCVLLLSSSGVSEEDLLRTVEQLVCPWEHLY